MAVTRSTEDNRSLVARLTERGVDVVEVPLIEVIGPADGGKALDSALAELARYRWVVLTSVNGVGALAARLSGDRAVRRWPDPVEVAAVGPATAQAAREAGMPVALMPSTATASALVDAFPTASSSGYGDGDGDGGRSNRVLAPLAELAGPTVEIGLAAKGWVVDRVEAYRTMAPGEPAVTGDGGGAPVVGEGLAVVAFFSPSVVDRWADRFGAGEPAQAPAPGPVAVCVGPSTAARARQRGFVEVVVADPHTEDGVIDAVNRVLG